MPPTRLIRESVGRDDLLRAVRDGGKLLDGGDGVGADGGGHHGEEPGARPDVLRGRNSMEKLTSQLILFYLRRSQPQVYKSSFFFFFSIIQSSNNDQMDQNNHDIFISG